MEPFLFKLVLVIVISLGISWGGIKKDRNWALVQFSTFIKFLAVFMLLGMLLITFKEFMRPKEIKIENIVFLLVLVLIFAFGVNEIFRSKIWFDESYIYFNSPYGKKIKFEYNEISSIKRSVFSTYVIKSTSGTKMRISIHMAGVEEFIKYLQHRISTQKNT